MNSEIKLRPRILVLWKIAKNYRLTIGLSFILGIFSAILEGIGLGLVVPILQGLTDSTSLVSGNPIFDFLSRLFTSSSKENPLQILMLVLLAITILKNGAIYGHVLIVEWLRVNLIRHLRCQIFNQLLETRYQFFIQHRVGNLWNKLISETNRTSQVVVLMIQQTSLLCIGVVYVGLLLTISWPLTLLVIAILGFLSFVFRIINKKNHEAGKRISQTYAQNFSAGLEALSAMKVIRLFGQEKFERARFDKTVKKANHADMRSILLTTLIPPITEIFTMGMFTFILFLSAKFFIHQPDSLLPLLLTFLFILYRIQPRFTQYNSNRSRIANNLSGVDAVLQILSEVKKQLVKSGSKKFDKLQKEIQFENVTFSYDSNSTPVLNLANFKIPVGKITAIVGDSGAGKSTLADLIPRFYEPDKGCIRADGIDIRAFELTSWRSTIGVVSQETFLFNASVRDNIAYGYLEASSQQVEEACHKSNSWGFISAMPQGLETVIGDRGVRLSGGQRQRIAIARAILRNPQILILDEATSALDTTTERLVQEEVEELSQNRTVLVITHRLSTIANASKILVLKEGVIVEQGTHKELLRKQGTYAENHFLQFSGLTTEQMENRTISS